MTLEPKPDPTRLAIQGGRPVLPSGPPVWPPADDKVRAALEQAYGDGSWGRYHGPNNTRLATALAEFFGVEHVTLCCSGTIAVQLALRGLGIGADDEVILAGYDFPGNFRSVEATGATPVLVDVVRRNWCLDPAQLPTARSEKTKAVIVSHLHGGLVPMREICHWAKANGVAVVEDACQATGAMVEGRRAGTWGDVGVLSFGGSKLLTAGRGGALLTNDAEAHQRIKVFCEQGNHAFPLSELQAAVLVPQVARLLERHAQRRASVERLLARLEDVPCLAPPINRVEFSEPAYYKLGFEYLAEKLDGRSREDFLSTAQAEGVAIDAGFRGFTRRGSRRCRKIGALEESERAAASTVILHHPVLLEPAATIDLVAAALQKVARTGGEW
jgi:dTDP-4-amino-4,6-dideoxygalactose transaminase